MVEVQLNSDTKVPKEMLIAFAICTTLLVAVHMLALMISTCILPNIEAICNLHSISLVHESPHERLHWYIEVAWAFSTLLGLLLFLFEIAILCWVKFYDFSKEAAWSACVVLIPVLIIFIAFAIHFYRSLVAHKYEVTVSGIRELELLREQIESTDVEGRNGVNLMQTGVTHVVWKLVNLQQLFFLPFWIIWIYYITHLFIFFNYNYNDFIIIIIIIFIFIIIIMIFY